MGKYTNIDDPSAYFQTAIYTGNGGTLAVTNDGNSDLQPDLVWTKARGGASHHTNVDSSRGAGIQIYPNLGNAEETVSGVSAFLTNGFSLGSNGTANANNVTHVAWQWKANGGTRTTFSESGDNPAGGYQANTTGGFSIVDYTGTQATGTVAHGLGAVPKMIIVKDRDAARSWSVYHHQMGSPAIEKNMHLSTTAAVTDYNAEYWGGTDPTTSVFSLGNAHDINYNDRKYIAYVFAEVQGYSKFGSYTGNGNANGPFVYTGFKPAFLLVKAATTAGQNWLVQDNKRPGYNPTSGRLFANTTGAENTDTELPDHLSNGFKVRSTSYGTNKSGETYIYMAFAENPFVTSTGIMGTAR